MERLKFSYTTEYRFGEIFAELFRTFFASELLFVSLLRMLKGEFAAWSVSSANFRKIQIALCALNLLFGLVAPAYGRFCAYLAKREAHGRPFASHESARMAEWQCSFMKIMMMLTEIAVSIVYFYKFAETLWEGVFSIAASYIQAWNEYYRTNIYIDASGYGMRHVLGVAVLMLTLFFLSLRYLTDVRGVMLLPHALTLSLGLLVNHLPGWEAFALLFIGILVLFSGRAGQRAVIFRPSKNSGRYVSRFFSFFAAPMIGMLLVLGSGRFFAEQADKLMGRMPTAQAFQIKLEERIYRAAVEIETLVTRDKEFLNNRAPRYTGETILRLASDKLPKNNLYLAEFHSGSYKNNQWNLKDDDCESAAAETGIDEKRMEELIYQAPYEFLVGRDDRLLSMAGARITFGEECNYRIRYGNRRMKGALVPYFSDLSDAGDTVWVEDGLAKKDRRTKELVFRGRTENTDISWAAGAYFNLERYLYSSNFEETTLELEERERALDWYGDYVRETYTSGATLSAVREAAELIVDSDSTLGERMSVSMVINAPVLKEHIQRVRMAEKVRDYLAENASYETHLDSIPPGTDTVQYFLETGHEGYCMHFASAGTLILQELGVPARYAAGYVVRPGEFRQQGSVYEAKVRDQNAHAWVEIFLSGIGWVPVEMTPSQGFVIIGTPVYGGQEDSMEQHNMEETGQEEAALSEDDAVEPQGTSETEEDSEPESEMESARPETESIEPETGDTAPDTAGDTGPAVVGADVGNSFDRGRLLRGFCVFAGILTAVGFAAAVIYFVRYRYRAVLRDDMESGKNRRAVGRINRRIVRCVLPGRISDAEYERRLASKFPAVSGEEWHRYMDIMKKMAFSEDPPSDEEVQFCYRIYRRYRKGAKREL